MADTKTRGFVRYLPLVLDALRAKDPEPVRPAEALAFIRDAVEVAAEDLTRHIQNGRQSIFENQVHWARFYLVKAGLLDKGRRGLWSLTPQGRRTRLTPEDTWQLYVRIRDSLRAGSPALEEARPAPADDDPDEPPACWLVSTELEGVDQLSRFREEGIWQHGGTSMADVHRIRPADRLAAKVCFAAKNVPGLEAGRKSVPVMRILATATVLENAGDGRTLKVVWDPPVPPRDWYFYTYRSALAEIDPEKEAGRQLIDFLFNGVAQDLAWFLAQPYWQEKYGAAEIDVSTLPDLVLDAEIAGEEPRYTVDDILEEGCFLTRAQLSGILERWREKKNLILQGPPGTGKTWLAKRLGFALAGAADRDTARSRLRVVQFHPSLTYEDFVRGWRPAGDGRLELVDGVLLQSIRAAESEPDRPFVLVIEEINRGQPAQIFGEMLTLLEAGKRRPAEGLELAYRRQSGERVHVPENLYLIGTMNVADRSLALMDLALRRRFAFIGLAPAFGQRWRAWCRERGLDDALLADIEARILALNELIATTGTLGAHLCIGHAYLTPDKDAHITDGRGWFRARIETEIGPLLEEYWHDAPEEARSARARLLAGL